MARMGTEAEKKLICSELLTSILYNINAEASEDDIADAFSKFYTLKQCETARELLITLNIDVPTVSYNKREHEMNTCRRHIHALFGVLKEWDSVDRDVIFVAADLSLVCHIPLTDSDHHAMLTSITTLHKKIDNVEVTINKLAKKKKEAAVPLAAISDKNTYANVAAQSIIAGTTSTGGDKQEVKWSTVTNKKKKTPKLITVGTVECGIRSVKPVKVSSVFVSRCDPSTTVDDVKTYLSGKNFEISFVEKLKTKFASYASFRVDMIRGDMSESECLKPEYWPANVLVRRFVRTRPLQQRVAGKF